MFRIIHEVLSADELKEIRAELARASFLDGQASAKGAAKAVKNNLQLDAQANMPLIQQVTERIAGHNHVGGYALPVQVTPVLINCFGPGMAYGNHIDRSMIGKMRADLSCTLFLSDPASYEGGELVVETEVGEQAFKLPAGSLLLYPANRLHRVNEVTQGQRLAAVCWIQSAIADYEKRNLCVDLDIAMHKLVASHGASPETDDLSRIVNKLRHIWQQ